MNQISKLAVDEFEKRMMDEKTLLFGCETESGFFERIRTYFLPFLRTDVVSAATVAKWQETNTDLSPIIRVNNQLNLVFLQLWRYAVQFEDLSLKHGLINILRKVKGPARYIEISSCTLIRAISCALKPLYAKYIAKTDESFFTFAPEAYKQEKREREFHSLADNDPSFLWNHMMTLENCLYINDAPNFPLRWETIRGNKSTIGVRAYQMRQNFALALRAPELRAIRDTEYGPGYFAREVFVRYIERLCSELLRILKRDVDHSFVLPMLQKKEPQKHWRTLRNKEDLQKLCPIAAEVWRSSVMNSSDPSSLPQKEVVTAVRKIADSRGIALHSKCKSRYKNAAKQTDPRVWKNGKYLGLTPGY